MGADVTGIDVPRVSAWLEANVKGSAGPFGFELIAGGRSNLTFRVTDAAGAQWALRRPPVHHVLPTAHDMVREHTVLSAVGSTWWVPPGSRCRRPWRCARTSR